MLGLNVNIDELKMLAMDEVDRLRDELVALSAMIHDNPELRYEEFKACDWITDLLERNGFDDRNKIIFLLSG